MGRREGKMQTNSVYFLILQKAAKCYFDNKLGNRMKLSQPDRVSVKIPQLASHLMGKKTESFPSKTRNETKIFSLTISSQHCAGGSFQSI